MKKTAIILLMLCAFVFAQETKPKIAVYVTGLENKSEKEILASEFLAALVQSKKYEPLERGEAFLNEIAKEYILQESGSVDEEQMVQRGKKYPAVFLCVVKVTSAFGVKRITGSIINMETGVVVASGNADSQLSSMPEVLEATKKIVEAILEIQAKASTEETFTDQRDGKSYRIMNIGGLTWFAQELNYKTDQYTHSEAKTACPSGWRLPINSEWNVLAKSLTADILTAFTRTSSCCWWSATTEDNIEYEGLFNKRVLYKDGGAYDQSIDKDNKLIRSWNKIRGCDKNSSSCNPKMNVRCIKD
jgi:TolB-like protein